MVRIPRLEWFGHVSLLLLVAFTLSATGRAEKQVDTSKYYPNDEICNTKTINGWCADQCEELGITDDVEFQVCRDTCATGVKAACAAAGFAVVAAGAVVVNGLSSVATNMNLTTPSFGTAAVGAFIGIPILGGTVLANQFNNAVNNYSTGIDNSLDGTGASGSGECPYGKVTYAWGTGCASPPSGSQCTRGTCEVACNGSNDVVSLPNLCEDRCNELQTDSSSVCQLQGVSSTYWTPN